MEDIMRTRKRFVAFVDILGFRDLVTRSPDLTAFKTRFMNVIRPLRKEIQRFGIEYRLFSDSLFVVVRARSREMELLSLLSFCKKLMERALLARVPLRGAVGWGPVFWDDDIIVGTPIIEAVQYEESQDWVGIILAPTVAAYLMERGDLLRSLIEDEILLKYDSVPVKSRGGASQALAAYVINFPSSFDDHADDLDEILERMEIEAGFAGAQRKYRNTRAFAAYSREISRGKSSRPGTMLEVGA